MKIKVGTQLTLEPTFTDKTEKYRCKVVDLDEQFIYIDYPTDTISNRTVFLMDGMQLRATFVEDSKAVYAFQTEVLGKNQNKYQWLDLRFQQIPNFCEFSVEILFV